MTLRLALAAFASFAALAQAEAKYLIVVGMASEAKVARGSNVVVITGAMREQQLRAKLAALDTKDIEGVVSFGVAGGLDAKLKVGELMISDHVLFEGGSLRTSPLFTLRIRQALQAKNISYHRGTGMVGVDKLETGGGDFRSTLRSKTGGDVVDMESHVAAQFASARDLPFAVIRSLSDAVGDVMPPAAMEQLDENGDVQMGRVVGSILRDPSQIPLLMKTSNHFKAALRTLKNARSALSFVFGQD